ncbi:uncharacterized protein DNG_10165 [Cephalotrichum gorgonifer]|uniref:Uncharacterized protein n=1 Tax=Cephalotrichum gorgonifer TaxID=2041049 RepID=A0AAE8T034_9PEZI|nr:uncharacterized protein DNG_10165 [Cephalotrichum gorgonifer]
MRINPLTVGFLASRLLLPGALATPVATSAAPVATSVEDQEGGWILSSPGYLVPVDMPEEKFDVDAPWMTPVIDSINRDANESIFDADGFDVLPQKAAALEARGQASTRFWLGRNMADMGCGETISSIRSVLGDAVYSLCKGGLCDAGEGVKYVRKITWMATGTGRKSRWLEITTMGVYTGDATLGNIHNAVKASVRRETVKWAWRWTVYPTTLGGVEDRCKMAKFPNYIRIDKPAPNRVDVQFWIKLNTIESNCLVTEALSVIGGAIHGAVGGFFGAINMMCANL